MGVGMMLLHLLLILVTEAAVWGGTVEGTKMSSNITTSVLGRYVDNAGSDGIRFDHPGVMFAIHWASGVTRLALRMSVAHPSTTTPLSQPPLGCDYAPQTPPPASYTYQPHRFTAFLFSDAALRRQNGSLSVPPPLSLATARVSFDTVNWTIPRHPYAVPLFDTLNGSLSWAVFVIKLTEADWNVAFFGPNFVTLHGYDTDVGFIPPLEGRETPPPDIRRIEFVGDSITAGYCNRCLVNNTFINEDFVLTWGYRAAEAFGAAYHTEAWSGYGVLRNCNGGTVTMTDIYTRTLATVGTTPWRFSAWVPDVLVINLGTNDGLNASDPTGDFERLWVDTYTAFVNVTVSERYGPSVRREGAHLWVFLACGPMQTAAQCEFVLRALDRLTAAAVAFPDTTFAFLDFIGKLHSEDLCCEHPSGSRGDKILEKITVSRVASVVGWEPNN